MRTQVFHRDPWIAKLSLEEFVRFKFEVSHIATAAWCCREFPFAKRILEGAQDIAGFVFRSSFCVKRETHQDTFQLQRSSQDIEY